MLGFDDARWSELHGRYRIPYDPRQALLALQQGRDVEAAWNELWNELHHQGDVVKRRMPRYHTSFEYMPSAQYPTGTRTH